NISMLSDGLTPFHRGRSSPSPLAATNWRNWYMVRQRMAYSQLSKSSVTNPQTHRVFGYGTRRRGHGNHSLLEMSKFIGEAATLRNYWMITNGVFPVVLDVVPADFGLPPLAVAGEIYHVDDATLERLDRLERKGRSY